MLASYENLIFYEVTRFFGYHNDLSKSRMHIKYIYNCQEANNSANYKCFIAKLIIK